MKTLLLAIAITVLSASAAAQTVGTRKACHVGNLEPKTAEDYAYLRSQRCVTGSVLIHGQFMIGDEVMETLDLGDLVSISGFLYVSGCPRLKWISAPNLRRAFYLAIWNNPMLSKCKVLDLAIQTGNEYRYDASLDAQEVCY